MAVYNRTQHPRRLAGRSAGGASILRSLLRGTDGGIYEPRHGEIESKKQRLVKVRIHPAGALPWLIQQTPKARCSKEEMEARYTHPNGTRYKHADVSPVHKCISSFRLSNISILANLRIGTSKRRASLCSLDSHSASNLQISGWQRTSSLY